MMSQSSLLSEKAEEKSLKEKLEELQKQLGKKQSFEDAVSSIKSLFIQYYPSASPSLKKSMYSVVCRVATILRTRHTAPGFWLAGKGLFEEARHLVTESSKKQHLQDCISSALEHLPDHQAAAAEIFSHFSQSGPSSRYLFEGHLTVDPEPPRPIWLVAQDVLSSIDVTAQSSQGDGENRFVEEFRSRMGRAFEDTQLDDVIEASLQEIGARPRGPPPASKEAVGKLPIITVTEEILIRLGSEMECAVCRENLVVGDKMQELPCKHLFHPPCLKPWLDEHNSCPICRYELPTDDHAYESQKERDKEAEEERKGAANALRGGEYMYV